MNENVLLTFAIVLLVYFVGLIVFAIIKRVSAKKKFKKEEKENESKRQNEINSNKE